MSFLFSARPMACPFSQSVSHTADKENRFRPIRFAGKTPVSRKRAFFRRQGHFSGMMQANNTSPLLDGDKKRLSDQTFYCHETVTENLLDDHE
jgi:hypothetical protein